jgi:hypothetical protein
MGEVVKLFENTGESCIEEFVKLVKDEKVISFVVCAVLEDGSVGSAIHSPQEDLYRLIGLLEASKSELMRYHEV